MGKDSKVNMRDKLIELIKETTPIKDGTLISKFGQILNVLGKDDIPLILVIVDGMDISRELSAVLTVLLANTYNKVARYSPIEGLDYLDDIKEFIFQFNDRIKNNIQLFNMLDLAHLKKETNNFNYLIVDNALFYDLKGKSTEQSSADLINAMKNHQKYDEMPFDYMNLSINTLIRFAHKNKTQSVYFIPKQFYSYYKATFIGKATKKIEIHATTDVSYPDDESKTVKAIELMMSQLSLTMNLRFDKLDNKIDNIAEKLNELIPLITEINQKTAQYKSSIDQLSFFVKEDEIEEKISDECDKYIKNSLETIQKYSKLSSFEQQEQYIRITVGEEAWNKLLEESKKFLATAKYTFSEYVLLGDQVDYSGVCLFASKVIEIELARRIVDSYEKYLFSRFGSNYSKYPNPIMKFENDGSSRPIRNNEFMLGKTGYIIGTVSKSANNYSQRIFYDFCRESLVKKSELDSLEYHINSLSKQIYQINEKYRKPAAHKSKVTMINAHECINYVIDVEKVLKNMLELFNY